MEMSIRFATSAALPISCSPYIRSVEGYGDLRASQRGVKSLLSILGHWTTARLSELREPGKS